MTQADDMSGWTELFEWEMESSGDPLLHPASATLVEAGSGLRGQDSAAAANSAPTPQAAESKPAAAHSHPSAPPASSLADSLRACQSLQDLEALCAGAPELRTDLEGTRLVFGVGNPAADLMLVGEAPGEQEDLLGEPFVGRAGQLLNDILKAIHLDREKVYIANILKHRPPGNRNPTGEERGRSLPYLLRQIELVRPRLILALGKISAGTLLGSEAPLSELRGTFHPFKEAELLVTYHPAALLRNPTWKRPTWEDVQLLRDRYVELGCAPPLSR